MFHIKAFLCALSQILQADSEEPQSDKRYPFCFHNLLFEYPGVSGCGHYQFDLFDKIVLEALGANKILFSPS